MLTRRHTAARATSSCFYDNNHISIEDDTKIALSEDTPARYEAYGWHVQIVEGGENVVGIREAIEAAKAVTDKPSFIAVRTIIGYPGPDLMNTGKAHGAALGDEEVAEVKEILGFDPEKNFEVRDEVIAHTRKLVDRGRRRTRSGSPTSTRGPSVSRNARSCSTGCSPESCPTAGTPTCRVGTRRQAARHPRRLG